MRHIKIFEDYSEEELRDLQDDLHDIGHKTKFVQGEDFGFDGDFKGSNSGFSVLRISKEMFDFLLKKGELKSYGAYSWGFVDPEKFEIPPSWNWINPMREDKFGIQFYVYHIDYNLGSNKNNDEQISIYNGIMKKLGQIRI